MHGGAKRSRMESEAESSEKAFGASAEQPLSGLRRGQKAEPESRSRIQRKGIRSVSGAAFERITARTKGGAVKPKPNPAKRHSERQRSSL